MNFFASLFRGRRYERDEPSSSVTVDLHVQGSVLSGQELVRQLQDALRRFELRKGDMLTFDQIQSLDEDRAAGARDVELMRRFHWSWTQLNAVPEHMRDFLWRLIQAGPDDGPGGVGVPA